MTMKCLHAAAFGRANDVLQMSTTDIPKRQKGQILIKIHACGLTPGDVRMLDGSAALFRMPENGFPYIPGGDISGIVLEMDEQPDLPFKIGDPIIARWDMMGVGGIAEYALVSPEHVFLKPTNANFIEGAAIVNSAAYAVSGVTAAKIKPNERVLVLGGSGGLGTFIVQLVRNAGAGYVACTSTDEELMRSLGVDKVINYKESQWWKQSEFQTSEGKFDVVIDCAEGVAGWSRCCESSVLKSGWSGGRWLAFVHNNWDITAKGYGDICGILFPPILRGLTSSLCPTSRPKYQMMLAGQTPESINEACLLFTEGKFKVVLHGNSVFDFTEIGMKSAFVTMEQRSGHGNVVIEIK